MNDQQQSRADTPVALLPCPFCGHAAQITTGDGPFFGRVQVECGSCRIATYWYDEAVAVRQWNRRVATSATETGAHGETVAWMHAGDPRDCISDAKKRDMIKHAGAPGARLAENYSIPLGRLGTPSTMAAAESAEERAAFEAWWYDIDEFQYGETDSAWAAWQARAAASPAAEAAIALLRDIINSLPTRRDWLDPATERAARDLLAAPQRAQADAPDDDRRPSGDHYRCRRCGATIAAGGKLTCERGPCPMELVPVAAPAVVRAPYQWRDTGALETGDA
ncbi:hypothetical protein WK07_04245 [Burkholderia multivorans]|uniref:Lar family restriction alleviation protein n=1 Tax=Burkholderia multivorans TaxID=87883 RepID=UPI00075BE7F0|nr:Lar family restriction alleviation protein [Burkholderia multivorans]KVQ85513.1 hypothetical protein WK07_04245 [Burkholderia multivorans]